MHTRSSGGDGSSFIMYDIAGAAAGIGACASKKEIWIRACHAFNWCVSNCTWNVPKQEFFNPGCGTYVPDYRMRDSRVEKDWRPPDRRLYPERSFVVKWTESSGLLVCR